MKPLKLFISYVDADISFKNKLNSHLTSLVTNGGIEIWEKSLVQAGENLEDLIKRNLEAAKIIVILVSPEFISSDSINESELSLALRRHENSEITIIPVIIKPCMTNGLPFAGLGQLPSNRKAVSSWDDPDEAWVNVVEGMEKIVHRIQEAKNENQVVVQESPEENGSSFRSRTLPLTLIMKGGGVKGLAYVGALKELEKEYEFDWYVGTSAGAIAAVLLASGYTSAELEKILFEKDFKDFLDANWHQKITNLLFKRGLHSGQKFKKWISDRIVEKLERKTSVRLPELPKRVTLFASTTKRPKLQFDSTDNKYEEIDAAFAVRCSMSIPGLFKPESHGGYGVFDGGLQNNYPVEEILKDNPNLNFIGLFLGPEYHEESEYPPTLAKELVSTVLEGNDWEALRKYENDTVVIDPRPIGTMDFNLTDEEKQFLVKAGAIYAKKFLYKKHPEKYPFPKEEKQVFEEERKKLIEARLTRKEKPYRILKKATLISLSIAALIVLINVFMRNEALLTVRFSENNFTPGDSLTILINDIARASAIVTNNGMVEFNNIIDYEKLKNKEMKFVLNSCNTFLTIADERYPFIPHSDINIETFNLNYNANTITNDGGKKEIIILNNELKDIKEFIVMQGTGRTINITDSLYMHLRKELPLVTMRPFLDQIDDAAKNEVFGCMYQLDSVAMSSYAKDKNLNKLADYLILVNQRFDFKRTSWSGDAEEHLYDYHLEFKIWNLKIFTLKTYSSERTPEGYTKRHDQKGWDRYNLEIKSYFKDYSKQIAKEIKKRI